jgi:hypothetical protein
VFAPYHLFHPSCKRPIRSKLRLFFGVYMSWCCKAHLCDYCAKRARKEIHQFLPYLILTREIYFSSIHWCFPSWNPCKFAFYPSIDAFHPGTPLIYPSILFSSPHLIHPSMLCHSGTPVSLALFHPSIPRTECDWVLFHPISRVTHPLFQPASFSPSLFFIPSLLPSYFLFIYGIRTSHPRGTQCDWVLFIRNHSIHICCLLTCFLFPFHPKPV